MSESEKEALQQRLKEHWVKKYVPIIQRQSNNDQ